MLANAAPATRHHMAILLPWDWEFCLLVTFLSVSTGYVGSLCLAQAPKSIGNGENREKAEAASLILTAVLVLGQAAGSAMSYVAIESL